MHSGNWIHITGILYKLGVWSPVALGSKESNHPLCMLLESHGVRVYQLRFDPRDLCRKSPKEDCNFAR